MTGWRRRVLVIGALAASIWIGLLILEHAYFQRFDLVADHIYCGEDEACPAWTERGFMFLITGPLAYIFLASYPLLTAPSYLSLGAVGIGSGLARWSWLWQLTLAATSAFWALVLYGTWSGIQAMRRRRTGL